MNVAVIDVATERRLAARALLPSASRKALAVADGAAGWRISSLLSRLVFFSLTAAAIAFCVGFLKLIRLPAGLPMTVATIALAEMLIRQKRFLRTGIEEALWLGGLFCFIFSLPSSGRPEAVLVFVAAFLIVGVRLSHGLFLTLATFLLILYVGVKWDSEAAGVASLVVLLVAIGVDRWMLRRPSVQLVVNACLLVLPTASAFLLCHFETGARPWRSVVVTIAIASAMLLAFALHRSVRPLVAPTVVNLILCSGDLLDRTRIDGELVALLVGAAMLGGALVLERRLRGRTAGFTSDRIAESSRLAALEMIAATAARGMAPHSEPSAPPEHTGPVATSSDSGGSFGGAGATGEF